MRCLYDRANDDPTSQSNLQVNSSNSQESADRLGTLPPSSSQPPIPLLCVTMDGEDDSQPILSIPYVAGTSEEIRRICRGFNLRLVFQSGCTLYSMLTRVKSTLPQDKNPRWCTGSLQL